LNVISAPPSVTLTVGGALDVVLPLLAPPPLEEPADPELEPVVSPFP
jgi:hypothetical protein